MRISSPSFCFAIILIISAALTPAPVESAELLYLSDPNCGPCQIFEKEVLPVYPNTEEARQAPLRKVNIAGLDEAAIRLQLADTVQLVEAVWGTPTFILVHNGREINRFSGYSSDELFWMSVQRSLNLLNGTRQLPAGD